MLDTQLAEAGMVGQAVDVVGAFSWRAKHSSRLSVTRRGWR